MISPLPQHRLKRSTLPWWLKHCGAGGTAEATNYGQYSFLSDGATTYIDLGNGTLAESNADPFAFAFWYKATASHTGTIFEAYGPGGSATPAVSVYVTTGTDLITLRMIGTTAGGTLKVTSNTAMTTSWQHVILGYNGDKDANNCRMWLNGSPSALTVNKNTLANSCTHTNTTRIALNGTGGVDLNGTLGDFYKISIMPTDAQALEFYNAGMEIDPTTLSFYATIAASARTEGFTWDNDDLTGGTGSVTGIINGTAGTPQNTVDAVNRVLDTPA